MVIAGGIGYKIMLNKIASQASEIEELTNERDSLLAQIESIRHDLKMKQKFEDDLRDIRITAVEELEKSKTIIKEKLTPKKNSSGQIENRDELQKNANDIQDRVYACIEQATKRNKESNNEKSDNPFCPSL